MSIKLCDEKVFFDNMNFNNKAELFEFITEELTNLERVENPKRILQKFYEKENDVTTFLGSKFAVPHLKSSKVLENTIVFIRLSKPIIWNENGDLVENVIAVLMKPNYNDLYIDILMSISRKIIDSEKLNLLKTSKDKDEIIKLINLVY